MLGQEGRSARHARIVAVPALVLAVAMAPGCSSNNENKDKKQEEPPPAAARYEIGGSVSGLVGTLVLLNNGGDDLQVTTNGAFTFATTLAQGNAYAVTVATQPSGPNQVCTVADGSGTVGAADVTSVAVTCVTSTYTIGVTVSGLAGSGLVLRNNGGDDLAVSADGAFTFATAVSDGGAYAITVASQPTGLTQTCDVASGAGFVAGSNVTSPVVTCVTDSFKVKGVLSGADGAVVLQLNGGHDLTLDSNGAFEFATSLADGSAYVVSVLDKPARQRCSVAEGTGSLSGADAQVSVGCSAKVWTPPASVSDSLSLPGTESEGARVAMNDLGDTIIVWSQQDESTDCGGESCTRIFMSEHRGGMWAHPTSHAEAISPGGMHGYGPVVAMRGDEAIITWSTNSGLLMSEYRAGAWTHPTSDGDVISPGGPYAWNIAVDIDIAGDALIVWLQGDDTTGCDGYPCTHVFMSERRDGAWTHPTDAGDYIGPTTQPAEEAPRVAMSDDGTALIVWAQWDGLSSCIGGYGCKLVYLSEYRDGTWTHPAANEPISPTGANAYNPKLGVDAAGNAFVVWQQSSRIFLSEYRGGTWTHPSDLNDTLSLSGTVAGSAGLAVSRGGDAVVVWTQSDGGTACGGACQQLYRSHYRGGVWTHPSSLAAHVSPTGRNVALELPEPVLDTLGNAIVLWIQEDASTDCSGNPCTQIYRSEFRDGAWSVPTTAAEHLSWPGTEAYAASTAMAANDDAVIVWMQLDDAEVSVTYVTERR